MTDETQETPQSGNVDAAQPVSEAIREAVESSRDTADQVRQIVVDLFSGKRSPMTSARDAIRGMLETASEIANRSAPEKAESVVKNVIDGIATGLKSVAQTTQDAVQDATARGQRFANEDVERAKKDLSSIGEILVDTAKYFAGRVSSETGSAFQSAKSHAEQTMAAARPVVASSLEALAKHPIQTAMTSAARFVFRMPRRIPIGSLTTSFPQNHPRWSSLRSCLQTSFDGRDQVTPPPPPELRSQNSATRQR